MPGARREPRVGDSVFAMNHAFVGDVTAVAPAKFEVSDGVTVRWLRSEAVFTIEGTRITLVCTLSGLSAYLVE